MSKDQNEPKKSPKSCQKRQIGKKSPKWQKMPKTGSGASACGAGPKGQRRRRAVGAGPKGPRRRRLAQGPKGPELVPSYFYIPITYKSLHFKNVVRTT